MSIDYTQKVATRPGIAGQYVTGENVFVGKPPVWLSDAEYGAALGAFVPVCVDLLATSPVGEILLGKRQQEPQPDWWIIGGRMLPGETYESAGARKAWDELGIMVTLDQFSFLGFYSHVWDTNAQDGGGCHMLSITLRCRLTHDQVAMMAPNKEYSELQWLDPHTVTSAPEGLCHPGLVQVVKDYLQTSR